MNTDHPDERSYGRRESLLGAGEARLNTSEQTTGQSRLSTSDIAKTGERDDSNTQHEVKVLKEKQTATPESQETHAQLFSSEETKGFRSRWETIQVGFVDEPRRAVQEADGLVATTVKRLAEVFNEERKNLENQWSRGDQVSTEDLRLALQRYRSFFSRLLAI